MKGLKSGKYDGSTDLTSDIVINGTDLLFKCISNVFTIMLKHSYAPKHFIMLTIVPIPKGMKLNIKCSENYRPISISSLLGKVFDKIIISQQHDILFSSSYQFGFKPLSSTVLCSTFLIETIEHYVQNSRQPAYVLLLDASKAFDRVCYNELFTRLIERNVSPFVIIFMLFMYTNHSMHVKWKGSLSDIFSIGNGVRQGAVLSPLLFTLYIDMLFIRLQDLGLGCHIGPIFAGSFGYADDVALVAPT